VLGLVWQRCLRWGITSACKKRERKGLPWSMGDTSVSTERATPSRLLKLAWGQGHTVLHHRSQLVEIKGRTTQFIQRLRGS